MDDGRSQNLFVSRGHTDSSNPTASKGVDRRMEELLDPH